MSSISIHFKDATESKIKPLLDYVRSLDFVQSIEIRSESAPAETVEKPASQSFSNEFLEVAELKNRFPNQWVLLANTQKNETKIIGGQVLLHEIDKRTFALKAKDLLKKHPAVAHFFTGETATRRHIGLARKLPA